MKRLSTLAAALWIGFGCAQIPIGLEVPEGSSLSISHHMITFDLSASDFPPPSFPAHFDPTDVEEPLRLRLFSNIEGAWVLQMDFEGLLAEDGGETIVPSQLEYRLDEGPWFEMAPLVTLVNGQGVSNGYETHQLEFRLRLLGNEVPGFYEGTLVFNLTRL